MCFTVGQCYLVQYVSMCFIVIQYYIVQYVSMCSTVGQCYLAQCVSTCFTVVQCYLAQRVSVHFNVFGTVLFRTVCCCSVTPPLSPRSWPGALWGDITECASKMTTPPASLTRRYNCTQPSVTHRSVKGVPMTSPPSLFGSGINCHFGMPFLFLYMFLSAHWLSKGNFK